MTRRHYLTLVATLLVVTGFGVIRRPAPADSVTAKRTREEATASVGEWTNLATIRPNDFALFSYAQPANARALDRALPAPAREIHYVRVDRELIDGKHSPFWQRPGEGRVTFPLPGGGALTVMIDGSEMLGPDRFTSTGRVQGRPLSRVVFAYNAGFLHASIADPEQGTFVLRAATGELAQFYQVDPSLVGACGGERRPEPAALAAAAQHTKVGRPELVERVPNALRPGDSFSFESVSGSSLATGTEVHVMMVYTQSVLPTLTGAARVAALQSAFDAAIANVNAAFAASLITARVRLVRIHETRYDENASAVNRVQDDALTALATPDDGKMDEVHTVRDAVGADVVFLALNRRDSLSSGLSFLLDRPQANGTPEFAYSVVQFSDVAGTTLVAHELGHVLGCAHDRENALSGEGAYPYSFGYKFFGADGRRYHDIMAYPPGIELAYFSNPNVILPLPIGAPLGIAAGRPGESDTARTIEQTAFAAAAFRLLPPSAGEPATLVNVATRAFVGGQDQFLIGGFVIEGTQPKRVLVRGVGPGLSAFGVTNALADPVLHLIGRGGTIENDNWTTQQNAGDIVAATTLVGGFSLNAGSRDAALLVTLSPGPYLAVVAGAGGATGSALVETYEVERGGSRLVNVSTRGYADNRGRELIGGFVVQGTPGSTRRILVRALGPTLTRDYAIENALFDPMLELRNAGGELLIENDDWTSGSRLVGEEHDDFQPTIRYYSEQQITAAALAPRNRREPCVLVDLPPGNYTVVAKPFENFQQPAQPGVGLIEVYEIKR